MVTDLQYICHLWKGKRIETSTSACYFCDKIFEVKNNIQQQAEYNFNCRLTPTMLIVLAFHSTWLVHLTRGPFWDQTVGEEYRRCRRNWWTNMLYVNNFINKEKMVKIKAKIFPFVFCPFTILFYFQCLQQTWYLACDTQLFALSLLIIFFMKKYEKHSKLIIGTVLTTGILVPFIISYLNNYDILVRHFPE